jgi:hypothetical protein
MNRSTVRSLSLVVASAFLSLWPLAAGAQPAPSADMTVDQVREAFLSQGYQVDEPVPWWTTNHVTTFTVSDASDQGTGRVLMVLVYPDTATAVAELDKAEAREAADTTEQPTISGGPHLVPGYGPSVWRQNVALIESTQHELSQQYAAQLDRDNLTAFGTSAPLLAAPAPATYAVDLDFLTALDNGTVNL